MEGRRRRSGIFPLLTQEILDQRREVARWGQTCGRWSDLVAALGELFAERFPSGVDPTDFGRFLDSLSACVEEVSALTPAQVTAYENAPRSHRGSGPFPPSPR
jgi:hypothetical protein